MKAFVLILFMGCAGCPALLAQPYSVELYKIKVVTLNGNRLKGILDDVSSTYLTIGDDYQAARYGGDKLALTSIKKVVLRRHNKRLPTVTGAIVGGMVTGALAVQSARKSPFRSPVLYGLNLTFAVGAGAAAGALLGNKIGNTARRVVRPIGRTTEEATENLRRQLEPFTYQYQTDVLNRVKP